MTNVAFTGGRDYLNRPYVWTVLSLLYEVGSLEVHVGDCPTGADLFVRAWCDERPDVVCVKHKAHWNELGLAAGPERNGRVVEQAELLVAFKGNKGTEDCIAKAKARGIPVFRMWS